MKVLLFLFYKILYKRILCKNILFSVFIYSVAILNAYIISYIGILLKVSIINKVFFIIINTLYFVYYFFPEYRIKKKYLPAFLPLSNFRIVLIEIMLDFIEQPFYFIFFNIGLYLFGDHSFITFIGSTVSLINMHFFARMVQSGNYINTSKNKILYFLFLFVIISIYLIFAGNDTLIFQVIALLLFIGMFIILELKYFSETRLLLFSNNLFNINIVLSFIVKMFFLGLFIIFDIKHINSNTYEYLGLISMTPILIFTYIFGNLFGYYPKVFLNLFLFGNNKQIMQYYLHYLIFPLLIDIIIFLLFFFIMQSRLILLLIYIASILVLVPLAFITSFLFPKPISSKFSFKNNNPFISSITLFIVVTIIVLPYFSNEYFLLYIIFPFFIFIYPYIIKHINLIKNKMFNVLINL